MPASVSPSARGRTATPAIPAKTNLQAGVPRWAGGVVAALPRWGLLSLIRGYQLTIGQLLPPACRFQPTCSRYAYTAIERHGLFRGTWLAIRRLARCHPFGGSGYDPVP